MFLHIGGSQIIFSNDLIGIFDYNLAETDSGNNSIFYDKGNLNKTAQKNGSDIPKSFIVTDSKVFVSPISPLTLSKRQKNSR